eukprot:SAG11_NODE_9148_length_938_cov_1.212157_2_plen_126_part_00
MIASQRRRMAAVARCGNCRGRRSGRRCPDAPAAGTEVARVLGAAEAGLCSEFVEEMKVRAPDAEALAKRCDDFWSKFWHCAYVFEHPSRASVTTLRLRDCGPLRRKDKDKDTINHTNTQHIGMQQ